VFTGTPPPVVSGTEIPRSGKGSRRLDSEQATSAGSTSADRTIRAEKIGEFRVVIGATMAEAAAAHNT
jgi:hypothetical protein